MLLSFAVSTYELSQAPRVAVTSPKVEPTELSEEDAEILAFERHKKSHRSIGEYLNDKRHDLLETVQHVDLSQVMNASTIDSWKNQVLDST